MRILRIHYRRLSICVCQAERSEKPWQEKAMNLLKNGIFWMNCNSWNCGSPWSRITRYFSNTESVYSLVRGCPVISKHLISLAVLSQWLDSDIDFSGWLLDLMVIYHDNCRLWIPMSRQSPEQDLDQATGRVKRSQNLIGSLLWLLSEQCSGLQTVTYRRGWKPMSFARCPRIFSN